MKKNCYFKSIFYRVIVLLILTSTMLCGCKKEKAKEENNKQISDISAQNDIDALNKEESEDDTESDTTEEDTTLVQPAVQNSQMPQQDGQSKAPVETAKDYNINSAWVIQNTVLNLRSLISQLVYSENMTRGQVVDIPISKQLSEQDISDMLHDSILDLIEYDLYLEYQNNPYQSHPVVLDYTYSLKYKGFSKDNTQHVFEIRFVMNEQSYRDEHFDSSVVVSQVTERILNHAELHMNVLSGDGYTEARMIEGVQTYEGTTEAVESLTRYVANEIEGALFGMAGYTQFRLEFYAKGATSYTFILYLK